MKCNRSIYIGLSVLAILGGAYASYSKDPLLELASDVTVGDKKREMLGEGSFDLHFSDEGSALIVEKKRMDNVTLGMKVMQVNELSGKNVYAVDKVVNISDSNQLEIVHAPDDGTWKANGRVVAQTGNHEIWKVQADHVPEECETVTHTIRSGPIAVSRRVRGERLVEEKKKLTPDGYRFVNAFDEPVFPEQLLMHFSPEQAMGICPGTWGLWGVKGTKRVEVASADVVVSRFSYDSLKHRVLLQRGSCAPFHTDLDSERRTILRAGSSYFLVRGTDYLLRQDDEESHDQTTGVKLFLCDMNGNELQELSLKVSAGWCYPTNIVGSHKMIGFIIADRDKVLLRCYRFMNKN